jgi:hypothetical protein
MADFSMADYERILDAKVNLYARIDAQTDEIARLRAALADALEGLREVDHWADLPPIIERAERALGEGE